jgi:hypothetical protein
MNEPNNRSPKERKLSDETLDEIGGWLVVCGLVIEVILALVFHGSEPWFEQWPLVFANLVIVIGVWIEIHFGGNARAEANAKTAEANKIAATANERAAILEKEAAEARHRTAEIEKLTAWRRILPEQTSKVADFIRDKASSIDLLIEYQTSNPEAYLYACDIVNVFQNAGVEKIRIISNSYLLHPMFGLYISAAPDFDASIIKEAFDKSNIPLIDVITDLAKHVFGKSSIPNLYFFVAPSIPPNMTLKNDVRESNI